jgi:hypothetical protein
LNRFSTDPVAVGAEMVVVGEAGLEHRLFLGLGHGVVLRGIGRLPEMPQFSRTGFYPARILIQWIGVIPQVDITAL